MLVEISVYPHAIGSSWWRALTALAAEIEADKRARLAAMERGRLSATLPPFSRGQYLLEHLAYDTACGLVVGAYEVEYLLEEARKLPGWQDGFLRFEALTDAEFERRYGRWARR